MDKSEGKPFSENYAELVKRTRTFFNDPTEEADAKRKLLLLTCQEAAKSLNTKSASLVLEQHHRAYTQTTSRGKLFEDKLPKSENKSSEFKSALRNSKALAGLLKEAHVKSSSVESERDGLHRLFNTKSDYVASNRNREEKYVNPLLRNEGGTNAAQASTSRGFNTEEKRFQFGGLRKESSSESIGDDCSKRRNFTRKSEMTDEKIASDKKDDLRISDVLNEDMFGKVDINPTCDDGKLGEKTIAAENRVSNNQFKFSSEDWSMNHNVCKVNENVVPLKQINRVEETEKASNYTFKKTNYKRNNDDYEDAQPRKKYNNREDDDDDFKPRGKFNRFNKFGKRNDEDDDEPKGKYNRFNKAHKKNNSDDEDEDDPNSYYNKKKRNAELYKRRFKKDQDEDEPVKKAPMPFKTAREEFNIQYLKKHGTNAPALNAAGKKRLGLRGPNNKFVSPLIQRTDSDESLKNQGNNSEPVDERLKNIDPKMVDLIRSEIMDFGPKIDWNDIAGLEFAKTAIQEAVVWPMLRPDIFTGLRRPPKGILLFGPPGTGKTLIGKCVASQSQSTFFSISASSLTSKWIGDGEKMVRTLFAVARCHQPAVIFIDEIDSLLSQRSDSEHESSRRIKTEFLVQLDGATTDNEERLLLIGATNRPQELDEAARRRFVKRLYIPLPEFEARLQLVGRLMSTEKHSLDDDNVEQIARLSDGYSGADMRNLCADACMGPIRSINLSQIQNIQAQEVRPVAMEDFSKSLNRVRPSVSSKDLDQYLVWDKTYGSGAF